MSGGAGRWVVSKRRHASADGGPDGPGSGSTDAGPSTRWPVAEGLSVGEGLEMPLMSPEPPVMVVALRIEALALGRPVVVAGMGPRRAARAGAALARRLAPGSRVVVCGVCGALDPALSSGTVVVADTVGRPGAAPTPLPEVPGLAGALRSAGLVVVQCPIVSVGRVARGEQRRRLAATAAAVDMESAALVEALDGHPVAVVRVVADTPVSGLVSGGVRALRVLHRLRPVLDAQEWDTGRR